MSIKSRVLAFLTCLMLGVSMISPAFVRADEPSPTPTLTPEEERTLINGLTYDQWVTGAELLNKFFFGYVLNTGETFDAGDYIDAISLLDDIYEQQTHSSGGHRFASDDQINYLDNALQMGIMGYDTLDNLLNDYPMTVNDLAGAARGRGIYAQGINNITENAPEQLKPYLDALTLSTLQIDSTNCYDSDMSNAGWSYQYDYDASNYSVFSTNSFRVDTNGGPYIYRGVLDFMSRDLTTQTPLYSAYYGDSAWSSWSQDYDYSDYPKTSGIRMALLIPEHPEQSFFCGYSSGVLQYIDFSISNDNVRNAFDISTPIQSNNISGLTANITYTKDNETQTFQRYIGGRFFSNPVNHVPMIPAIESNNLGAFTSCRVATGWGSEDPYPGYDDVTKILMFLSGYFRNVDIYLGDSWATATPLVGPRGWSVTPPTTYTDPISGNDMGPIEAPSGGTINLYQFMLWFLQQDWKNRTVTINNITNNVNIMTPPSTQDNPTPTPQTTVLYTPVDIDINQNNTFDFSDNYFNGDDDGDGEKNHIPYSIDIGDLNVWDGDSDDGGFGLWSKPIPDWDGNRVTPAPVVEVGTRSYRAVASAEQEDLTMSPAGSAYTLVKAGAAFIGPIAPYIWFIVGALVVVSLVVRLLHG